jgi:hypothetical protein
MWWMANESKVNLLGIPQPYSDRWCSDIAEKNTKIEHVELNIAVQTMQSHFDGLAGRSFFKFYLLFIRLLHC